eukprot:1156383-Pelagomonas_calceolata.AAC.10
MSNEKRAHHVKRRLTMYAKQAAHVPMQIFEQYTKGVKGAAHIPSMSVKQAAHIPMQVFDQYKKDAEIASKQRAQLLLDCEAWKSKCIASARQFVGKGREGCMSAKRGYKEGQIGPKEALKSLFDQMLNTLHPSFLVCAEPPGKVRLSSVNGKLPCCGKLCPLFRESVEQRAQVKGNSGKQEIQEGGELQPPPESSPSNEV